MTENDAKKVLEIFDRKRKEYMQSIPPVPYFDKVTADNFTHSLEIAIEVLEEIQQYQAIGTVEECREARERQKARKPVLYQDTNRADCPVCGNTVRGIDKPFGNWCSRCGQKLDWGILNGNGQRTGKGIEGNCQRI